MLHNPACSDRHKVAWTALLVLDLILIGAAGCSKNTEADSGSDEERRHIQLQEVWELYQLHGQQKGRVPGKQADVKEYEPGFTLGFMAIQQGDLFVSWGTPAGANVTEAPLAWEKDAPTKGGLVLMNNGKIRS